MTGDEMKAWRERHRMTQAQAAQVLGASVDGVSGWERAVFRISPATARLCDAWDVMRPEQRKQLFERWGLKPAKKGRGRGSDDASTPRR